MVNDPADALLSGAAKQVAETRSDCPGSELLHRFRTGMLEPNEAAVVKRHVRMCGYCELSVETSRRGTQKGFLFSGFLRNPVFAYALAGLLSLVLWQRWNRVDPRPRLESVAMLNLNQDRDVKAAVTHDEDQLLLFFQLPDRPGTAYTATVEDAHGNTATLPVRPFDQSGNFGVLIDRRQFSAGYYKLHVAARNGETSWKVSFNFEL